MAKKVFNGDAVIEGISDYIKDLFDKIPDENKVDIAIHISVEAAINGAANIVEGVGILEVAKIDYYNTAMQIMDNIMTEELTKNN